MFIYQFHVVEEKIVMFKQGVKGNVKMICLKA